MKGQTHAVRDDLLRGIRWGVILLLAALLGIAAFRALNSAPAAARDPVPAVEPAPASAPLAIEVGDSAEAPDPAASGVILVAPSAPPRKPVPARPAEPPRSPAVPLAAPEPSPVAAAPAPRPVPAPDLSTEALPDSAEVQPAARMDLAPSAPAVALTPPPEDTKAKGNAAGRLVRSVGRVFGLGRKEPPPAEDTKK